MAEETAPQIVAFAAGRRIATGPVSEVAVQVKRLVEREPEAVVQVLDLRTSRPVDLDLRGSETDVRERILSRGGAAGADHRPPEPRPGRGRGRPRLGVVGREVTLLPRHWEWLGQQPGGASAALRRLVESARREGASRDATRQAQEATYRFMAAVAGDEPGFEEAARALFAGRPAAFSAAMAAWPKDVREHASELAAEAFAGDPQR